MESIFQGIKILEMFYKGLQIALILLIFLINFSGGGSLFPPQAGEVFFACHPPFRRGTSNKPFPLPPRKNEMTLLRSLIFSYYLILTLSILARFLNGLGLSSLVYTMLDKATLSSSHVMISSQAAIMVGLSLDK